MGDRLEDMIRNVGQESFQQENAHLYDILQNDSKKSCFRSAQTSHGCQWC